MRTHKLIFFILQVVVVVESIQWAFAVDHTFETRELIRSLKTLEEEAKTSNSMDEKQIREILLKLGVAGDESAKLILRKYASMIPVKRSSNISGIAQISLAKLGNEKEFQQIVNELSSDDPFVQTDAFTKLGMVGNKRAVNILGEYLFDNKSPVARAVVIPKGEKRQGVLEFFSRSHLAAQALAQIVVPPPTKTDPQLYTNEDIEKWRDWWEKNKGKYK